MNQLRNRERLDRAILGIGERAVGCPQVNAYDWTDLSRFAQMFYPLRFGGNQRLGRRQKGLLLGVAEARFGRHPAQFTKRVRVARVRAA
jgi:hypothetical protein